MATVRKILAKSSNGEQRSMCSTTIGYLGLERVARTSGFLPVPSRQILGLGHLDIAYSIAQNMGFNSNVLTYYST